MEHEYIFEKENGLYTRVSYSNDELAREAEKILGWKLVRGKINVNEAIKFCEEHNKPILEDMLIK